MHYVAAFIAIWIAKTSEEFYLFTFASVGVATIVGVQIERYLAMQEQ